MKQPKFIIYLLMMLMLMIHIPAISQTHVFIPDINFRNFLNASYPTFMDVSGDSLIIDSAATVAGTFTCSNQDIVDLTGIEYFINIIRLECDSNQLTTLPNLSNISALNRLECNDNQITSLPDFSANTAISHLFCNNNLLSSLPDLSANLALEYLDCKNNQITDLPDLSENTALKYLYCDDNLLTSLPDLSANTALLYLYCNNNQLTSLPDLSANTALSYLCCNNNLLTSLPDLSSNTNLWRLCCNYNQLTGLPDLSNNTTLHQIYCHHNQITSIPDISNTAMTVLYCSSNQITSLPDLSSNTGLASLYIQNNQISSLPDLSINSALKEFDCSYNQITSLPDFSENSALWLFYCDYNKLDFSDARELRIVDTISNLYSYDYEPQSPFDNACCTYLYEGDMLILSVAGQDSALSYQWFKDEVTIPGATDTLLTIPNVALTDSGMYTCRSYGTALESPPMNWGPGISEFVSEPVTVKLNEQCGEPDPQNIIENGNFETCTPIFWSQYIADHLGVTAQIAIVNGACKVSGIALSASPEYWDVQLKQEFSAAQIDKLEKDSTYTLSFDASAETDDRPCRISFEQMVDPWANIMEEYPIIGTETETWSYNFVLDSIYDEMQLSFQLGTDITPVIFDNVKLVKKVGGTPTAIHHAKKDELCIFPNPASDYLHINAETGATIRLYNSTGMLVKTGISVDNRVNFDVTGLPAGLYFVTAELNDHVSLIKVAIL